MSRTFFHYILACLSIVVYSAECSGVHLDPPSAAVRRGINTFGGLAHVQGLVQKVKTKDTEIVVSALGGSITAGVTEQSANWFNLFVEWLKHQLQGSNPVRSVNLARHGMGPEYAESCVLRNVPNKSDIVFLEFAVNDWNHTGPITASGRLALERIIRHLLGRPYAPQVVLVMFHPLKHTNMKYYDATEDKQLIIAQFYGIPVLSSRSAFYNILNSNSTLRKMYYLNDMFHPSVLGHRWQSLLAISLFSSLFHTSHSTLSEPETIPSLGAPMFPGNDVSEMGKCYFGEDFRSMARSSVGFAWQDETHQQRRFGFVGLNPHDHIQLCPPLPHSPNIVIMLSLLHSYAGMGIAEVSCTACTCDAHYFDTSHAANVSVPVFHRVDVVNVSNNCCLNLRVSNRTRSNNHKIKLMGMMTSSAGLDSAAAAWINFVARVYHTP